MFKYMEANIDKFDHFLNAKTYGQKLLLHVSIAVFVGILINDFCKLIQKKYKLSPVCMIFIQFFLLVSFLYFCETYISKDFALEWQTTTPGFIFIGLIFSLQYNLFKNFKLITFVKN